MARGSGGRARRRRRPTSERPVTAASSKCGWRQSRCAASAPAKPVAPATSTRGAPGAKRCSATQLTPELTAAPQRSAARSGAISSSVSVRSLARKLSASASERLPCADLGAAVDIEDLDIGEQLTGGGAHRGEHLRSWHVLRAGPPRGPGAARGRRGRGRCSRDRSSRAPRRRRADRDSARAPRPPRRSQPLNERVQLTEPADRLAPRS